MNILLIQGVGNSEQDMARICSRNGRVVLVQRGWNHHVEIWEGGLRTFVGPMIKNKYWRLGDALFGLLGSIRVVREALKHCPDKPYDVVIGTVYDNAHVGLFLRCVGKATRCISMACDYLPLHADSPAVRVHRRIARWLSERSLRKADGVWLVSPRIPVPGRTDAVVMPLYISRFEPVRKKKKAIAFVGYPTADHGLETLFEISARHGFEVHLVGDSAYLQSLLPRKTNLIHWHGMVTDRARVHELVKDCFCGYAIYKNVTPDSFLYYGVWSKIYTYWGSLLPVVTTPGSYTSDIIQQHQVSKVAQPEPAAIEKAVLELWNEHEAYVDRLDRFVGQWNQGVEEFLRSQMTGESPAKSSLR
jgi:hypothetical protein